MKLLTTAPNGKDAFWQVVLLPTISILNSPEFDEPYTVFSLEWLFWSLTFVYEHKR